MSTISNNWLVPSANPSYKPLYIGTYYKSANQNMINGSTDVTFDLTSSHNNTGGYITHTNGTTNFTVAVTGLYQLEFNSSINSNGATWNVAQNKVNSIDITRIGFSEVVALGQANVVATGGNYIQSVSATFYLQVGDIINCRCYGNFATATPNISGVTNTFDLNTFFTWTFIQ
jgi:hypothetical protein